MKRLLLWLSISILTVACSAQQPATATVADPTAVADPTPDATATAPQQAVAAPQNNVTTGCVTDYAAGVDYFPTKVETQYSSGFTVEYFDHYKIVTLTTPFPGAAAPRQYLLLQCGTPLPADVADMTVIELPVERFVAMSTTYLPPLVELGVVDRLVGVDSGDYASTEAVRTLLQAGQVAEIGAGAAVNVEAAIDLEPDVIMTYGSGSPDFDAFPKLEEAGLTVVLNADFLDSSPLGRAEWIKYISLFFNAEATANATFDDIAANYEQLVRLAADVEERPTVFTQTPYEGTWYPPGGQSYAAQLLHDAGANYVWREDGSSGSLFLDFETVLEQAADADYWLDIGFYSSRDALLDADDRFAEFAAFESDGIYNNDRRMTESGGNDYYESGALHPDQVLADLIKIFHPQLLPDHQFVYYRPIE